LVVESAGTLHRRLDAKDVGPNPLFPKTRRNKTCRRRGRSVQHWMMVRSRQLTDGGAT